MGFDAFVICRCYQDGKTKQPPGKEYIKFDSDGLYIDMPNTMDKDQRWDLEDKFDEWISSACPHDNMELCREHLCNNQGMYDFVNMLIESKDYPTLSEYLPRVNVGMLPSEKTQSFGDELYKLQHSDLHQIKIQLCDASTQKLLMDTAINHNRTFIFSAFNEKNVVLSKDGLIITENEIRSNDETIRHIVFQSKHFTIRKVRKSLFSKEYLYQYTDIDTGKRYDCDINLRSDDDKSSEFIVSEKRMKISEEYSYIIEALSKLVLASIETGNPIHWT